MVMKPQQLKEQLYVHELGLKEFPDLNFEDNRFVMKKEKTKYSRQHCH
jgi:hypothetical protein